MLRRQRTRSADTGARTVTLGQAAYVGDSLERPTGGEMAIAAIGQAFATFLGLAVGGPAGAVLGSALGPYGIRLIQLSAAEWGRKSEILAETALDASGVESPEEFFDILSQNPALSALMQRILWAASMSGNDSKLRAFGSLLGGAVARRGDRLDETEMLSAVLADIEKPHVITLEILASDPPDAEDQSQEAGRPATRSSSQRGMSVRSKSNCR